MYEYNSLPLHMQEGVRRYIEEGVEPGAFLRLILSNDFVAAACVADDVNRYSLLAWADWLMHSCPINAWGSNRAVDEWIMHHGARGGLVCVK